MKRIYIDFDSTLYDTSVIKKNMATIIAESVCESIKGLNADNILQEVAQARSNGVKTIFGLCEFFEKKYNLDKNYIRKNFETFLANGEDILYADSIPFLKRLTQKGYEVNILTYVADGFDYQMHKIMGTSVIDNVTNIIMCTKSKGELALDYENGYFIDDNPKELVGLFNAGVSEDRIFRIVRKGAGYADVKITEFDAREYNSFDDIEI